MLDLVTGGIKAIGSIAGGAISAAASERNTQKQMDAQYDFAKNGISWKVQDAKNAGIHPLYALGAQTSTYTPVNQTGYDLGQGIADAGDAIGNSVASYASKKFQKDQQDAMFKQQQEMAQTQYEQNVIMNQYKTEHQMLENELLRKQISGMDTPSNPQPEYSFPLGMFDPKYNKFVQNVYDDLKSYNEKSNWFKLYFDPHTMSIRIGINQDNTFLYEDGKYNAQVLESFRAKQAKAALFRWMQALAKKHKLKVVEGTWSPVMGLLMPEFRFE